MSSIVWSARGTTTYSAWPPPRPPKYSPCPKVDLSTHWLNQPFRQSAQCPQAVKKLEKDTDRDNFLSAKEAVEYGLIDEVIEGRNTKVAEKSAETSR